jgi:hypothetical protein
MITQAAIQLTKRQISEHFDLEPQKNHSLPGTPVLHHFDGGVHGIAVMGSHTHAIGAAATEEDVEANNSPSMTVSWGKSFRAARGLWNCSYNI